MPNRHVVVGCTAAVLLAAGGCGGGGGQTASSPGTSRPTTTAQNGAAPAQARGGTGSHGKARRATRPTVQVPRGWHRSKNPRRRNWPVPVTIAASFPIHRVSGDASCPYNVLRHMPPDGVYVLVAEFTRDRPAGIPPKSHLEPRGDLRHLDIRPSEVECWNGGPSGAKDFEQNGRAFRVEILLGSHVSPERRRRALEALASFRP